MPSKIHFICKQGDGLHVVDKKGAIYLSESWLLSPSEIEALQGGRVVLHAVKSQPSYFGGTILDIRPTDDGVEEGGRVRCSLTVQSALTAKGLPWDQRGHSHGMAWTTGVLEDDAEPS